MRTNKVIDPVGTGEMKELLDYENGPCVSIYMATHDLWPETRQDPIRLRNLLKEAEDELTRDGMRGTEARDLLEPARDLLKDNEFWAYQDRTLAIFIASGLYQKFRLPIEMESRVGVDRVFHVIPLLRATVPDTKFYLLSLNKENVRLLKGSRYFIEEIDLKDLPTGLREFLADTQVMKSLQFHSGTGAAAKDGRRRAMHHGQGVQDDKNEKERISLFFQRLDEGIRDLLPDEKTTLVLAGQPHVLALYREASHTKNLVDDEIDKNPSDLSDVELHERAWKKVRPMLEEPKEKAMERFMALHGKESEKADARFQVVLPASLYRKVDTLFVPHDKARWGLFNEETHDVALHSNRKNHDTELFNRMAVNTQRFGGTVYPVESEAIPNGNEIAAVLR